MSVTDPARFRLDQRRLPHAVGEAGPPGEPVPGRNRQAAAQRRMLLHHDRYPPTRDGLHPSPCHQACETLVVITLTWGGT
jgi:hypothetical protein